MTKKTEIVEAEKETGIVEVSTGEIVADFIDYSDFGAGFEGVDSESFAIPFIYILQKTSPLVDENKQQYIEGSRPGMFFNTVSQECYEGKEKGILFIPCAYKRSYILWGSREVGGSFKGVFTKEQFDEIILDSTKAVNVDGRYYAPDQNGNVDIEKADYYVDTRSHFILLIDEETGDASPAIIALSSTQIKASKTLLTLLNQRKANTPKGKLTLPMFANLVRARTQGMENNKGSWSGIKFTIEGLVKDQNLFNAAKEFSANIIGDKIKADFSKSDHLNSESDHKPTDADEF